MLFVSCIPNCWVIKHQICKLRQKEVTRTNVQCTKSTATVIVMPETIWNGQPIAFQISKYFAFTIDENKYFVSL